MKTIRLLGPHVNATLGGLPEYVANWYPAVSLVVNPEPVWKWVAEATPKTTWVWRLHFDESDQPDFNNPTVDPIAAAETFVAANLKRMLVFGSIGIWQGYNELAIHSAEAMRRFGAFEAERLRLMAHYGLRGGIGAFATGNPSNMGWWSEFLPAFEAAKRYGGILLLHQYFWHGKDSLWYELRHRLLYDGCPDHGWPGLPDHLRSVPLIIAEAGGDYGIVEEGVVKGWVDGYSPEEYVERLAVFDGEIHKDAYVLGAAIYCCGNITFRWSGYDIWPHVARMIVERSRPLYSRRHVLDKPQPRRYARGIDVSQHQGAINWKRVADSGIEFAIIRASVGISVDPMFRLNHKRAENKGLPVGTYHFMTPTHDPEVQAVVYGSTIEQHARSDHPRLFDYVDLERWKYPMWRGPDETQFYLFASKFASEMGYPVGVYTNVGNYDGFLKIGPTDWAGSQALWVADWKASRRGNPRMPSDWKGQKWQFQQTTSHGAVPGIRGRVDLDIYNGTRAELRAQFGGA